MKKNNCFLVLVVLFTGIIALTALFSLMQFLEMRPKIMVSQLDIEKAPIPERWQCKWCKTDVVAKWVYEELDYKFYSTSFPGAISINQNDIKIVQWSDENNGYVIELIAVDYGYPLKAKIYFDLENPKGRLQKIYWNFTYAPENIMPPSWDWVNTEADEEIVLCGNGTQDHCTGWFYQARYGQYYLLINFWQDLGFREFEAIVKAINSEFIKNIK